MSDSAFYRQTVFFLISLGIYFLLMVVIERIGVDQLIANHITAFYAILLIAIPTIKGGAIRSSKFFFAERKVTSGIVAIATASIVALPFMTTFSGYFFYKSPALIALFSTTVCVAVALFSLLIARPFRQSGATSLANFQIGRFKSTVVARLASLVHLVAGVLLLIAGIKIATNIGSWFFAIHPTIMSLILFGLIFFVASFGGIASLTRQSAIAMICLLIAINIPLALESFSQSGFPAGFISFVTSAMVPFFEIENQLREEEYKLLDYAMTSTSNSANWSNLNWNIAAVLTALGTLATPSLMQQFTMPYSSERASNSGQKTVLVVGGLFLSIFALMAFLKLSLYETLLGLSTFEIRQEAIVLYKNVASSTAEYVDGLVAVCGDYVNSHADLIAACGGSPSKVLTLSEIQLNGDLILAGSGMLMGYPYAVTGFLVIAILLTIIAFCSATILSISTNLISAYFSSQKQHLASAEMFLSRFTILLVGIATYFLGPLISVDPVKLIIFSFGIYTASLLPSLIATFYDRAVNDLSLVLSICVGFILTLGVWALGYLGIDLDASTADQVNIFQFEKIQIDPMLNAIYILPISALVLLTFRLIGKRETAEENGEKNFIDNVFDDSDEKVLIRKNRF